MRKALVSILLSALFIQTAFAEEYYYFYDHLGNVDVVTDETGEAVATYEYDPFGNTIEENVYDEDFENDYKYTGQEEDDETGLYYYNARYYSPVLGRFMSQYPAVYDDRLFDMLEDPQSLNPYTYARNNPMKYVDPSGEFWDVVWDMANFILDYTTNDTDDMAIDLIAATVPGIPSVANFDDAVKGIKIATGKTDDVVEAVVKTTDEAVVTAKNWVDNIKAWVKSFGGKSTNSPGEGWIWKGSDVSSSGKGNWVNEITGEKLYPDLNHPDPKGVHWDYTAPDGSDYSINLDGEFIDNKGNILGSL